MSRGMRMGLTLVVVLVLANLGMAAVSWQEAQVGWDPQYCCGCYGTAQMLGQFIVGVPFSTLVSLAILRRRRERAVVKIFG